MHSPDKHVLSAGQMAHLKALVSRVRRFLEAEWPLWHQARGRPLPTPLSRGTCQTSSLFLAQALCRADLDAVVVQGNDPSRREGFFDGHIWHGHAWVQSHGLVLDVTADQFGQERCVILPHPIPHYKSGQRDTASAAAKEQRQRLVAAALCRWQDVAAC